MDYGWNHIKFLEQQRTDGMAGIACHKPKLNLFLWVYRFPFSHTNLHPSLS